MAPAKRRKSQRTEAFASIFPAQRFRDFDQIHQARLVKQKLSVPIHFKLSPSLSSAKVPLRDVGQNAIAEVSGERTKLQSLDPFMCLHRKRRVTHTVSTRKLDETKNFPSRS